MREVNFRGKIVDGNEWRYGPLLKQSYRGYDRWYIGFVQNGSIEGRHVDPETIGMGTGVLDKEGKEIFEGDIVQNGDGGYFYIVYWWGEDSAFRGKQIGSSSTIGLNYWRKELRIVGNIYDNPELMQYKPLPKKHRDKITLLPGEFRIKGIESNGCMCQPDVIYVARWLTNADGYGKNGRLRIWAHGSWVEDGKRIGSYCDWNKSILQNYEVQPEPMSREAYEKFKQEYVCHPKQED